MNLIEKLIEAEIEKCKQTLKIHYDTADNNQSQIVIDASDHLTDLRNALQEYREMCKDIKDLREENQNLRMSSDHWDEPITGNNDDDIF